MGSLINRRVSGAMGMGSAQNPISPQAQGVGAAPGLGIANSPAIQQIKQMMGMLKGVQNPQAVLQQVSQQNPQLAQVMQMCNGKNPQDVFYQMCQQKGVNPEEILNALRA